MEPQSRISTQYWYNRWLLLKFKHWSFIECKFLCSFCRFHKVRTIFSRFCCSAKHPAEWGSEGWGVSRSHPPKCHSSFRQRHFSLHRMYQLNSFWLTFAVSTWTMVLFWWMCSQAQRVPARKQQVEATRATAGKDAKTHLSYTKTWIHIFPDVGMLFLFSKKSPWAWNGPHRESPTPDISPCLLWSVDLCFVCQQTVVFC